MKCVLSLVTPMSHFILWNKWIGYSKRGIHRSCAFFFMLLFFAREEKSALQWRWRVRISREVDERQKNELNIPGEAAGREDGVSLMWRNKCFREVDGPRGVKCFINFEI